MVTVCSAGSGCQGGRYSQAGDRDLLWLAQVITWWTHVPHETRSVSDER
jgi:hypothetical protein